MQLVHDNITPRSILTREAFENAIRTLAALVMAGEDTKWTVKESWMQISMLGIGVFGLFLLGLFPQILQPFLSSLPKLFEHLFQ